MPTRNIVLTDHQAALVERLVASGRYQNASEVLRQGLRLLEREEAEAADALARFREAVAVGEADIAAGRYVTIASDAELDAFMASLDDPT